MFIHHFRSKLSIITRAKANHERIFVYFVTRIYFYYLLKTIDD